MIGIIRSDHAKKHLKQFTFSKFPKATAIYSLTFIYLSPNIFSCGAHGGGGHPGADSAVTGTLVNRFDVSVLKAEFGESFFYDPADLPAKLSGYRTVEVNVQTFRLCRGDLDHYVT